ncbi:lysophospholipid acyltransferase family protein [Pseudogemmatithrix spongiicola]|uniref:1-acyl-sn-glycerol-3-phosphate acyltransferase n=1 Tax=Pseudogemmatithrix spongiicola TaxID=3062599 RepID=A0AA49Q4G4_9BACT|nr:lysophospholipid acyltransferase family protein [Gemmatimonadaceae bacterium 'strain 138']WKW14742.1 lysophospholipid acyltransferase family protein [Gemmatimonadaceae bacterium 'strain 318']
MIRAFVVLIGTVLATLVFGGWVLLSALFRVRDRVGSPYDLAPRLWARCILWMSGVQLVQHGTEHKTGERHIFVVNHVANYDVLAVAATLRWIKFVAKVELFKIPLFGKAMLAAGMIPIERANRKAAFGSYSLATKRIQAGASVAVYPEGTRGNAYPLRPFKKGPFVLAIQSQAPIVPVVVYGQLAVNPKGKFHVRPGTIHVHFLPPIDTTGMTYDDRDRLADQTHAAMAACLRQEYQVH